MKNSIQLFGECYAQARRIHNAYQRKDELLAEFSLSKQMEDIQKEIDTACRKLQILLYLTEKEELNQYQLDATYVDHGLLFLLKKKLYTVEEPKIVYEISDYVYDIKIGGTE